MGSLHVSKNEGNQNEWVRQLASVRIDLQQEGSNHVKDDDDFNVGKFQRMMRLRIHKYPQLLCKYETLF